jgi:hypothetical protein
MPLDRTIDVTVPHTLPQQTAWERVLRWLNESKSSEAKNAPAGNIKPVRIELDFAAYRIRAELEAFGKTIKATISVEPGVVELRSEPIEGRWIEMAVIKGSILFSESRIYSQLEAALKP